MFALLTTLFHGNGTGSAPRVIGRATWLPLGAFYLLVGVAVAVLQLTTPLAPAGDGRTIAPWLADLLGYASSAVPILPQWLVAALAMMGAILLAIPLGYVYSRTRTRQEYDGALVTTVIALPSLITSILVVVQDSLVLAFCLVGLVAAVRFRSSLKAPRDAVYVLAAVGIGFAAGVHALDVAMVVSLGFVGLELATWKANLVRAHEDVMAALSHPMAPLGPVAPLEAGVSVTGIDHGTGISNGDGHRQGHGNGQGHGHRNGHGTSNRRGAAARLAGLPDFGGDHDRRAPAKRIRQATLRVSVSDIDDGRAMTESVLARMTRHWELQKTTGGGRTHLVLDYQVRLRKRFPVQQVVDALKKEGSPFVVEAELASS
jgi:hypothetical protein